MRALLFLLLAVPAQADGPTPTDLVGYRQASLSAVARHMKATTMIAKGQVGHTADLAAHTSAIAGLAERLPSWFPAGTGPDAVAETEALATIWRDPDGFTKAAKAFKDASAELAALGAKSEPDLAAIKAQLGKVGQACGGCHDSFKKDDD